MKKYVSTLALVLVSMQVSAAQIPVSISLQYDATSTVVNVSSSIITSTDASSYYDTADNSLHLSWEQQFQAFRISDGAGLADSVVDAIGTINLSTFDTTRNYVRCTNVGLPPTQNFGCSQLGNVPNEFGNDSNQFSGDLFSANGLSLSYVEASHDVTINQTWTFQAATVPVPAAAWMFGSGLMMLAGVKRSRGSRAL